MKRERRGILFVALACIAFFVTASMATAAVDNVRCVVWQGDPGKHHTAISGQSVRLKGVITTTDTNTIWYKWVFGDGSESAVTSLSGWTKYNVDTGYVYTGAVGTPFTAQLLVDDIGSSMTNAVADNYLVKIEESNLDARVNIAIDNGLWYLYTHPYSHTDCHTFDGSPFMVWSSVWSYYASPTASAVLAFEINNHKETGDPDEDPYVEAVEQGLNWLFNGYYRFSSRPMLQPYTIGAQTYGDPDANGNGIGIQVRDYDYNPAYEGGMIMDAIIASGTPDADSGRDFDGDGSTDTYQQIIQDMIDMYTWGQYDHTGSVGGGWRYQWNTGPDNSACQWAAIGMIPAETIPAHIDPGPDGVLGTPDDIIIDYWGIIPQWVKDRNNVWLNYSYTNTDRRFGYTGTGCVNDSCVATRPSGMVQMVMSVNNYKSDSRWTGAESWFADNTPYGGYSTHWNWFVTRSYYASYAFVKAMRLSKTETLSNGFDWYRGTNGIAEKLVADQESDLSWPSGGHTTHPGNYGDTFVTAWAIGMLRPALFKAAPIACFTAHPNPAYADMDIIFDPSCSDHSETGKDITNLKLFEWDWDDDGVYDENTSTLEEVTYAFSCASLPCTYPVTLKVTDDDPEELTATYTLDIMITNPPHPPVADADGPYMVSMCDGDSLVLDGSGSFDPNEGEHEASCSGCPDDTITSWDWDLTPPLTGFDDESGETVALGSSAIASYFSAGSHSIGLQVTDDTEASYPSSGGPNLTDADFTTVTVFDSCGPCDVAARPKSGKVQLTWTDTGADSYDIYRSTEGPNTGFVLIADDHVTTYATYLDYDVVNGTTYYYRVVSSDGCGSKAVSAMPQARTR